MDRFYVDRLKNLFRGKPHVGRTSSDVALADWEALKAEHLDTIVLSNVLEHIPDDRAAVRRFRQVLPPGGKLVVLVPALRRSSAPSTRRWAITGATRRRRCGSVLERGRLRGGALEWMNLVGIPGGS